MTKKTVRDIDLAGKKVLVRVDYNVPVKDGVVGDTLRIQASFETINYLLDQDCSVVLMSHLGRPDGKPDNKYTLKEVAAKAAELLGRPIEFLSDCIGDDVKSKVNGMKSGDIVLLENLRFHAEEEANDDGFAKQLADLGEVYVDDAFAAIHRAHASTVGVTKYLPAVAGLLVEKEVDTLTSAMEKPDRPMVAIIAGAKISTKIEVLDNLLAKVDSLVIGGAMANTFLAGQGHPVGKSLVEADQIETAKRVMGDSITKGVELFLPEDVVVSKKADAAEEVRTITLGQVTDDDIIVDVGPESVEQVNIEIDAAKTVIWNGPLGITEVPEFAKASIEVAKHLA
ncbi:MAG TPA: phosphoglycerate kinase, partial [Candidatus Nanoarchaeia archaeon]|nr:phosphoglycerate kinase [Candidatus Nanoarchaeia archaeon]